ncbi:Lnb N-terminal periplasmic domain-containing protein [Pararhizobium sp.]|uniref:Lnb N-terminal periplasmic domain-containing protein n=1 Tax=Pararhizobium sp. TaxID=1977563 RepID=UPI002722457D|nr:DUF4105 domain-containing protein [Pararhizobium sp.]MDO9414952.1 DUF4105 domain-containing protein [Pararhizobium sp.]
MTQTRSLAPRLLRASLKAVVVLAILGCGAWGALALAYQAPGNGIVKYATAGVWAVVSLLAIAALFSRHPRKAAFVYLLAAGALSFWWTTIPASNDRDWADEVGRLTTGVMNGNLVMLKNVRNFDWRSKTDYTVNWEDRSYDLDQLVSVDLLLSYWTGPSIAHTLVSFGFRDGSFVTFSVEIRKERHESFSEIGGFFKEFETSVIAADERDIVRVRTNIRREDVYLYRVNMPKAQMHSLFLAYVGEADALAEQPRFYHTVTANCTTIVYEMVRRIVPGLPLDHRLLLSGYLPEYIFGVGGFAPGFSLQQLRDGGRITDRALAADTAADFSSRIRRGVPGIPAVEPDT